MVRTARIVEVPSIGELHRGKGNLSRQLAEALRKAVRNGDLKAGEPLPSTRLLAKSLQVSRGTVIEAFEQLLAEGFLESHAGAGTKVASSLASTHRLSARSGGRRPALVRPISLPAPAAAFAQIAQQFAPLQHVPFAVSVPTGAATPDQAWRRLGNRLRARGPGGPAGYGDPQGALELREAIADYIRRSRSVHCDAEQIIVTAGTQQGLYLSALVLLGNNDRAWVEDPAYRGITAILETMGSSDRIIRVPVDSEGIDVNAGLRLAPDAKAAFVTPSHQYPLGMPLSMGRRNAILSWARTNETWIVEDDYDSELRYAGHPFPSLQGLDPEHVVYLGTFSKILFPSLRLGYAVIPRPLVQSFVGARVLIDRHPPSADQHVLAAFIREGHLDRHIRRIRGAYADCRQQLARLIEQELPGELAWIQPSDQGMHSVLWLAPHMDDQAISIQAGRAGVSVRPVSPMYADSTARAGLVLGLGAFAPEQIEEAVRRLAAIILLASKNERPRQSPRSRPR